MEQMRDQVVLERLGKLYRSRWLRWAQVFLLESVWVFP